MKSIVDDEVQCYISVIMSTFQNDLSELTGDNRYSLYRNYFAHVYKQRQFYELILSEDSLYIFYSYFLVRIREETLKYFKTEGNSEMTKLYIYKNIHSVISIVEYWYEQKFSISPEKLAKQCCEIDKLYPDLKTMEL